MRWLLDQGLPRTAALVLNQTGEDAVHVGDIGMSTASDTLILGHAVSEDRILITLDADFHSLLALSGSSKPSVIRIREEGLKGAELAALISRIANKFNAELLSGCVMTYLSGKVRHRALPF